MKTVSLPWAGVVASSTDACRYWIVVYRAGPLRVWLAADEVRWQWRGTWYRLWCRDATRVRE